MNKKFEFKPFDELDWEMYFGAEGDPEICTANVKLDNEDYEAIIVLDDNGINLDYAKDSDGWLHDFYFEVEGKERARAIFNNLNIENATIEGLQAIGFVYNDLTGGM